MHFPHHTRVIAVGVALVAVVGLTACSSGSSSTNADGKCQVAALAQISLTGNSAAYSKPQQAGINAAVNVINSEGGVNGCDLVVDYADDNSDSNQTLPVLQSSLSKKDYAFVFSASYGTIGVIPYLVKRDVFSITGAGAPRDVVNGQATPHLFEVSPSTSDAAATTGKYAVENGSKKIGIVTDNTSLGTSTADAFKSAVSDAGGEVVDVEQVDPTTVDMTAVVQRLKAAGADTVYIDMYGPTSGHVVTGIKAAGWSPKVILGTSATDTNLNSVMSPDDASGTTMFGKASATLPYVDGVQKMLDQAKTDGSLDTLKGGIGGAVNGYSAFTIFAWAANGAASTDPAKVSSYIQDNTTTPVPNLPVAKNTGYSVDNHILAGTDALAVWNGSLQNADGFYPDRTETLTPVGGPQG